MFVGRRLIDQPGPWLSTMMVITVAVLAQPNSFVLAESSSRTIVEAEEYFPDQPGHRWKYRGRVTEGVVDQIADVTFVNTSTVMGEEVVDGVTLTVFRDTNPGNQGASDSYYLRDAAGIRYYGSKPGTELERQLIPYQIIRFPIQIPSSFQQLARKNLDLGIDLDRDGKSERVDVQAWVTIKDQEPISVPFATYPEAVRMEARMSMLVHLSRSGKTVRASDTMIAWFAKGVGLVKYIERQTVPMLGTGKDRVIEITEELEEAEVGGEIASFGRSKSPAKGVLTHHALNHELLQIAFPSRLGAHP